MLEIWSLKQKQNGLLTFIKSTYPCPVFQFDSIIFSHWNTKFLPKWLHKFNKWLNKLCFTIFFLFPGLERIKVDKYETWWSLWAFTAATFLRSDSSTGILRKFLEQLFSRICANGWFWPIWNVSKKVLTIVLISSQHFEEM